jgi:polyisoprenoid-binding protein YceI
MTGSLRAEGFAVDLDPAKTKIAFVVSDVLHTVHGTFRLKTAHISFDPSTCTISGDAIVDAASGDSGNAMRDRRMTRTVLQAQRFPQIRFTPTAYSGAIVVSGVSNVEVRGLLAIHGQKHKIAIPMQVHLSSEEVTAVGKFIVPYVKWGMKNPSTLFLKVNQKVEIDVTVTGHLRPTNLPSLSEK